MEKISYDAKSKTLIWQPEMEKLEKNPIGWRMLENNSMDGMIPFTYYYVDEEIYFCYSIRQEKRITDFANQVLLDFIQIYAICTAVLQVLCAGEEYFLRNEEYLLLPEYLFWDAYEKKLFWCYLPGREKKEKEDFVCLAEWMIRCVNHKDQKAVEFIYGLYDILITNGFEIKGILSYVEHYEIEKEEPEKKEESVSSIQKRGYYLVPRGNAKEIKNDEQQKRDMRQVVLKRIARGNCKLYEKENRIGRIKTADIVLPFPEISREHAVVFVDNNKVYVTDCNSKNGTYINGKKISAFIKTQCTPRDVLTFADISFRLET